MKSNAEDKAKNMYDFILNTLRRIEHLEEFIFRCGEHPVNGLNFEDALWHLKAGKKVRRKGWSYFWTTENVGNCGAAEDFLADDWEVVKEVVPEIDKKIDDWSL